MLQFTGSPVDASILADSALVRQAGSGAAVPAATIAAADCPASLGLRGGANYSEARRHTPSHALHHLRVRAVPLRRPRLCPR